MKEKLKETREILENLKPYQELDYIIYYLREICLRQQDEIEMLYEIIKRM